jgi:tripartite-type tricarboxylate transporter receptor subunit TctC
LVRPILIYMLFTSWFGVFAPVNTPKPIIDKLTAEIAARGGAEDQALCATARATEPNSALSHWERSRASDAFVSPAAARERRFALAQSSLQIIVAEAP